MVTRVLTLRFRSITDGSGWEEMRSQDCFCLLKVLVNCGPHLPSYLPLTIKFLDEARIV
jgi:hypothetical protein